MLVTTGCTTGIAGELHDICLGWPDDFVPVSDGHKDKTIENVEKRLQSLQDNLDKMLENNNKRFKALEDKFDAQNRRIQDIANDLAAIRAPRPHQSKAPFTCLTMPHHSCLAGWSLDFSTLLPWRMRTKVHSP